MQSTYFTVGSLKLHAMVAGPEKGPLVLLLHGFPDFWYGWRHQIPALAEAGFRVIALDQRGYNLSDKPRSAMSYRLNLLVADAATIIEGQGGSAAVVGHDWGGSVTWSLAMARPELVRRFAVINCPHPLVMAKHLTSDPAQMLRSRYIYLFQIPWLPEKVLASRHFRLLSQGLREAGAGYTKEDRERYREAWGRPGALRAGINWYRAMMLSGPPRSRSDIKEFPPGLLIWGAEDRYLKEALADESARRYPNVRLEKLPGLSHWAAQQDPRRVNELLVDFLLTR